MLPVFDAPITTTVLIHDIINNGGLLSGLHLTTLLKKSFLSIR